MLEESWEKLGKVDSEVWVAIVSIIVGGFLFLWIRRKWVRWILQRKFKRGIRGEGKARKYFEKNGYRVLSEQGEVEIDVSLNGVRRELTIRPDFIVKKNGKTAVIEVKTGKQAPDPLYTNTRRQLLEYWFYLNVDEAYLFDAEREELIRVDYGQKLCYRTKTSIPSLIFFFIAGAICAWIVACQIV